MKIALLQFSKASVNRPQVWNLATYLGQPANKITHTAPEYTNTRVSVRFYRYFITTNVVSFNLNLAEGLTDRYGNDLQNFCTYTVNMY